MKMIYMVISTLYITNLILSRIVGTSMSMAAICKERLYKEEPPIVKLILQNITLRWSQQY